MEEGLLTISEGEISTSERAALLHWIVFRCEWRDSYMEDLVRINESC